MGVSGRQVCVHLVCKHVFDDCFKVFGVYLLRLAYLAPLGAMIRASIRTNTGIATSTAIRHTTHRRATGLTFHEARQEVFGIRVLVWSAGRSAV